MPYSLLADGVLVLHAAVVVFVVGVPVAVLLGHARGWRWVDRLSLRALHLVAIGVVAAQAWLGQLCPLTVLESALREAGGANGYERSFVEHWLQRLLFYEAPAWVFTAVYTGFALGVVALWWRYPPKRGGGS